MTIECVEKHIKFGFKAKKSQAAISQLLAIFSVPITGTQPSNYKKTKERIRLLISVLSFGSF